MSTETVGRQRTYGGWQREKVAFLFGFSAAQAALLCGAALAAVTPFAVSSVRAAVLLWPAAVVLAAAALARVGGRTGDEWAAGLVSYLLIRSRGQHRFAGGPFAPARDAARSVAEEEPQLDLPGILAPLRILSVPAGTRDLAIVENRHERTWTAVARVRFPGIGLSDSARRDQRVAGWGALLASLCTEGGPLIRVQALQRLVPESGAALRSWHAAHLAAGAPDLAAQRRRRAAGHGHADHDAARGVPGVHDGRPPRPRSGAGGGRRRPRRGRSPGPPPAGPAPGAGQRRPDGRGLARRQGPGRGHPHRLRPALAAPARGPPRRRRPGRERRGAAADSLPPGVSPDLAAPVYAEARPGTYLHDGAVSASYWVHSWPGEAYSTALGPLLGDGSHRRSFAIVYEPLGPRAAEKAVMRERTARHVAVRMRQRTGQVVPEHERAAMERALGQDAERAAGHGLVRFTGYATVTAAADTIEDACAALEADAAAARIELRRIWFAQDSGFALGALPLGLGLPKRRW